MTIRKLGFIITLILLAHSIYSELEQSNNNLELNDNITNIRSKIDSLDKVIKVYLDENINNEYLVDFEIEKHIHQLSIDTLINKKISSLTKSSTPFYSFRDLHLDSTYFVGYLNPKDPDTIESLWIIPKKGVASNIETGRMVYGFANMHSRTNKLEIDFGLFDRIGIYSMFPEVYGSIEMIFSENKTMRENEISDRLIKQAHRYNTKVDLVLSYYNWDTLYNLKPRIDQDAVMLNMVDSVSSIIKNYHFDGITFDFDIGRMNLRDVLYYKKFIYLVNKEIKSVKKQVLVNIIISFSDIIDNKRYSLLQIDSAFSPGDKTIKPGITDKKSTANFSKLDLLLKPDLKGYIDYLLVNKDLNLMNLKLISDNLKNRYTINNSQIIVVLPLYSNICILNRKQEKYVGSIIQKNFKATDFTAKNDLQYLAIDSSYYTDDLSVNYLEEKIKKIWNNSMGLALWNIEYGDSSFFTMLHRNKYDALNDLHSPRIFIIKHLPAFRAFVDSYRITIGVILAFLLCLYMSFLSYAKIAGREKLINIYKIYFFVAGLLITFLCYLYMITLPFKINQNFELISMSILFTIIFIIISKYIYKLNKAKDLP